MLIVSVEYLQQRKTESTAQPCPQTRGSFLTRALVEELEELCVLCTLTLLFSTTVVRGDGNIDSPRPDKKRWTVIASGGGDTMRN